MNKYIQYLYPPQGSLFDEDDSQLDIQELDDFNVRTVLIPEDAIGFRFISAKDHEEAEKNCGKARKYFCGNADQVITREDLEKSSSPFAMPMLEMMKMQNLHLQFELPYGGIYMGMSKTDVVIDPLTREIVYPKQTL